MKPSLKNKDESIVALIKLIEARYGWELIKVVDHWEADMCAIGIASTTDIDALVYISTFEKREDEYYFELEIQNSKSDTIQGVVDSNSLLDVIRDYLVKT